MQFSRTFIVEDSEPMVHHELGRLLREAGYSLLPDGRYQRGSREGSIESIDPSNWYTRILADTRITPEFYTRVVLRYDVHMVGQSLKLHIRQFWVNEVNRIVTGLGGKVESIRDKWIESSGLDLISSGEEDHLPVDDYSHDVDLDSAESSLLTRHEHVMKNGANWFFWIAGLALINSIITKLDARFNYIFGLAATEVVKVFSSALIEEAPEGAVLFKVLALLINLAILAMFFWFGMLARRSKGWAFLLGMGLYFLDGVIFMMMGAWFAVVFHGIGLYGLLRGYIASRDLHKLEADLHITNPI